MRGRANRPVWLPYAVGVLAAAASAFIRWQFLEVLEFRVTFLTFYPAVALSALYGGFYPGLLATAVSAALARYFWMEPVGGFAITNAADLISIVIFLASGALISSLAEMAFRAQARALEAEERSRLAAEREQAAVVVRQSESKYRELVQNANSAIIRWNHDGTISFFNEYARKLFGYSAEEIIGKHVSILVPERESNGVDLTGLVRNIVNHPERYANNINENVLRDGGRIWMAWTNRPIFDENGDVAEILAVGTDITERKLAEKKIRDQNAILQTINLIFHKALTCDTEEIKADPTQMRQLFQNLIGNALKFHKESEKPVIDIVGSRENGHLRIVVSDNGIGFEEEYLETIFAPFRRLHGRSSKFEGTGMGLAICKKIVERHGGSITAKSAPSRGSSFVVTLPVKLKLQTEVF